MHQLAYDTAANAGGYHIGGCGHATDSGTQWERWERRNRGPWGYKGRVGQGGGGGGQAEHAILKKGCGSYKRCGPSLQQELELQQGLWGMPE